MIVFVYLFATIYAENVPYDMVARPAEASPGLWQRRTVDLLVDALMLLREQMGPPTEDDIQQVVKKGKTNHALREYS